MPGSTRIGTKSSVSPIGGRGSSPAKVPRRLSIRPHPAGGESTEGLARAVAGAKPGEELMALVDIYLSERHVGAPEQGLGCAIAAAGSDVPRQPAEVRRAASRRIKDFIGLVERQFPEWGKSGAHEKALGIAASLVGALMLARPVDDAPVS